MKRCFDVVFALFAGLLSLPIMLVVAVTVAFWLGRPVLFHQTRAGLDRRPFRMMKFRSMSDARDADGKLLSDAQRTGRFGLLLRRTRLDELPEFWNILVGDMSLIGPRPILPETIAALGERGALRCSVRPGLTGWAQISGNAILSNDEKLDLDLWYIANRSAWIDFKIVAATVLVMLFGDRISERRLNAARQGPTEP
ncbi:MAG TPA: sugar transferase [Ensifer sp.]|jgi:lipopolysaccharide/colanic/teichoic acid biosynthesis glycosyltransferase|uniref:sugar transferase n=1 Tax=Ensifer sp. TaxID=1872086 RepID=UPI002E12B18F|nr:sugar transferase [Ensifer sp.]